MPSTGWNRTVDVLIVGSGAAALTAAVAAAEAGAEVEMLEKSDAIGGTTAFSGGAIWAPCNSHMADLGESDTREEALEYIRSITLGREASVGMLEAYVDGVHRAADFLEEHTPIEFSASYTFSDYYADHPGGKIKGRVLEPRPFASRQQLGEWDARLREGPHYPSLTLDEVSGGDDVTGAASGSVGLPPALVALNEERHRDGVRTMGEALVGALLRGALDRGVRITTGARARELVGEDGVVVGAVVDGDGRSIAIRARRGVVLAAGGFEWNAELVRAYTGIPDLRPPSSPTSEGDGLLMALGAGAAVENMSSLWAYPVTYDGKSTYDGKPLHNQGTPRQEPGCIIVNKHGRRFSNEAICYMDFGKAHRIFDPVARDYPNEAPVWAVFDRTVRDRIVLGDLEPGGDLPDWVAESDTVAGLAEEIGVDPAGLTSEVERFNGFVAAGNDEDFGRGTVWFEGWTSGGTTPERALAPVAKAPFYALRIYDGAVGSAGGAKIDEEARVQSSRGGPVEGLYAAGNNAASVFGPMYPSGGVTLGQSLAFGYLAGTAAARRQG